MTLEDGKGRPRAPLDRLAVCLLPMKRLGLLRLLKAPGALDTQLAACTQQQSTPASCINSSNALEGVCRESLGSPDSASCCSCPHCCGCGGDRKSPCSTVSSLDWEVELADDEPAYYAKGSDAARSQQQRVQVHQAPQAGQRRRPVLPCLQLPCLQPTSYSNAGSQDTSTHPNSSSADCDSCGADVQRSAAKAPSRSLRQHRHSDGSVRQQQQPQQLGSSWESKLAAQPACQRINSSPAPSSRDALGMYGQHSASLPGPLLALPPAFQLTSGSLVTAAAAAGCSSEVLSQLPPQRSNSAVLSSSAAGSLGTDGLLAGGPVQGPAAIGPAGLSSPRPTQLLVVSPALPVGMQRAQWRLSDFWISQRLYQGYASSVYHAIDRQSNSHVALKVYHTSRLHELNRYQVLREVYLHAHLQHDNIIQMHAAFQERDNVVMVLEHAAGGDLYGLLRRAGGRLGEQQAVDLVLRPFLSALAYMHSKGVVHRDIKPENVLLTGDGTLKIADFGLAIDLNQERAVTRAGTLDYMAPEVLRCPMKEHPLDFKHCRTLQYNTSVDVWAVGVLAYELLVGFPPFSSSSPGNAMHKIMAANVVFPRHISAPARHFVAEALRSHPGERPTIAEMRASAWLNGGTAQAVHETHHLLSPTAVPMTQQQEAGPGFGEAALLRCFLAVQPRNSTNRGLPASSVPETPTAAQLLVPDSLPALPVTSPVAVRSGTAVPTAAVLSPVALAAALPRSCPDQNRLVQAVLACSGAQPQSAAAAAAAAAACSVVVYAPCMVLRYGRC
ncbi:kinase-like domain-containing protein [Scenedesmus sp. NREL 46B-D3]|nr:kinase-like domain-containing protein [Scenedesmus sp. NREL 46B-D3]